MREQLRLSHRGRYSSSDDEAVMPEGSQMYLDGLG
jgi:hypothetical protein